MTEHATELEPHPHSAGFTYMGMTGEEAHAALADDRKKAKLLLWAGFPAGLVLAYALGSAMLGVGVLLMLVAGLCLAQVGKPGDTTGFSDQNPLFRAPRVSERAVWSASGGGVLVILGALAAVLIAFSMMA